MPGTDTAKDTAQFAAALKSAQAKITAHAETRLAGDDRLHTAMRYAIVGGKMLRGFLVLGKRRGFMVWLRLLPLRLLWQLNAYMPIRWCMTTCPVWMTTTYAVANPLFTANGTRRPRYWRATACKPSPSSFSPALKLAPHAITLVSTLAKAAGKDGMVSGQMLDIAAESADTPLNLDQITTLQERKNRLPDQNGPPLPVPCSQGESADALRTYASTLGLAFQIADDILDVEGDAAKVGKALRKDAEAGKATFVSLLGLDQAKSTGQRAL